MTFTSPEMPAITRTIKRKRMSSFLEPLEGLWPS